jgi:hypothetical protein
MFREFHGYGLDCCGRRFLDKLGMTGLLAPHHIARRLDAGLMFALAVAGMMARMRAWRMTFQEDCRWWI